MIQLVQACAGKNWRPEEIHLTIKHDYEVEYAGQLNPSRIIFSKPHAKFKIPRKLLSLPILKAISDNCVWVEDFNSVEPFPETFVHQLVAIVNPYLGAGIVNKKIIANALDISPRTLQRRLQQFATSYSTIIDHARFDKAQRLLKDSDLTMLEISLMLGYQNASSFTRSFRRLSGLSPKEFRSFHNKTCSL